MSEDESPKEMRRDNPTGWLKISDDENLRFTIDALLENPPKHEESILELSNRTGIDEPELIDNLRYLEQLGVVDLYSGSGELFYQTKTTSESMVLRELFDLNTAVNAQLNPHE